MVVSPKHPKMVIFLEENPWLLGTTIFGNIHMLYFILMDLTRKESQGVMIQKNLLFTEWILQAWKLVVGKKKRRLLMGEISECCWDDP